MIAISETSARLDTLILAHDIELVLVHVSDSSDVL